MPDENKFEKLREIGYQIPVTCGICIHGNFAVNLTNRFGSCGLHRYQHLKHDNPDNGRGVSIVRDGTCSKAEPRSLETFYLGPHSEFLDHPAGDVSRQ